MVKLNNLCALWAFSVATQAAFISPAIAAAKVPGIHSEYTNPETGDTIRFGIQGYTGEVKTVQFNPHFVPTRHYATYNASALQERDICQAIANCAGKCADTAATFVQGGMKLGSSVCASFANGLSNYLTENNYAQTKAIIQGSVLSVFWQFATAPGVYYLNAALDNIPGNGKDACGETQPPTYASNAASGLYQFCLSIQQNQKNQAAVTTRFTMADTVSTASTSTQADQGILEAFISQVSGQFAPVCKDFGVVWRRARSVAAAA